MKLAAIVAVLGAIATASVLFAIDAVAWAQQRLDDRLAPVTIVLPAVTPTLPTLNEVRPVITEATELRAMYAGDHEAFFVELIRYDADQNPYAYDILIHDGQNMVLTQTFAVRCAEAKHEPRITPLEREHIIQICGAVWPTPGGE